MTIKFFSSYSDSVLISLWTTLLLAYSVVSFAYTFSPIMFRIEEYRKGLLQFLTSVCAIVGGVFTVRYQPNIFARCHEIVKD